MQSWKSSSSCASTRWSRDRELMPWGDYQRGGVREALTIEP
jgi:hypothetical protein